MTPSRLSDRAESMPKVGMIPGLGAGSDCELVQAFMRQALLAGYMPIVPEIIDLTDSEGLSIIPPLDVQAERAQPALDCDLVVIHSAGVLAASRALQNIKIRPEQRLVCVAPSVRNPGTTFDKYAKPLDELWATFGLTGDDRIEMEDAAFAAGYEAPLLVMPGASDVSRPIAISAAHARETYELNPPKMFAELLSTFATDGLGAWIKKWRHDSRLDVGIDTRTGKKHANLLEMTRMLLGREVQFGQREVQVHVEIMKGGSHFFSGRLDDGTPGEDAVMADVLGGGLFDRLLTENWKHDGVYIPQAV
jgi:hypothetical protein